MDDFLSVLLDVSVIVFAVSSMLSVGLGNTLKDVIGPLRRGHAVVRALLANFVLVPLWAVLILLVLPVSEPHGVGLFLIAAAAGAPFLIKLTEVAGSEMALSAALLMLLLPLTVIYMPLVVPLAAPEADVDVMAIARPLGLSMILPLIVGLQGKWHLSEVPKSEDGLERYGFSDLQQWGDMYGAPLQGAMLDGAAAFETVDWLEHRAPGLDQPWLLVSSLVNPHDIMFLQSGPEEEPHPNGAMRGLKTTAQELGFFERDWEVGLPDNYEDDLALQPFGVHSYKETIEANYGAVPEGRDDLWKIRRNYLVNCMRLVDLQFQRIVDTLDRLELWEDTVVILLSDHGEMNGAHQMSQKGAIHFDGAAICNLTVCAPGGPRGGPYRRGRFPSRPGADPARLRRCRRGRSCPSLPAAQGTQPQAGGARPLPAWPAGQRRHAGRRGAPLLGRAQHA